jgi:hypothetical protein
MFLIDPNIQEWQSPYIYITGKIMPLYQCEGNHIDMLFD